MAKRSESNGHPTKWRGGRWVWADTGAACKAARPCLKCDRATVKVGLFIQTDSDKRKWSYEPIDACIAPIVAALQAGGINMQWSCCGHGKRAGEIMLEDGRILEVKRCPDES
jgi:hypothetical protein